MVLRLKTRESRSLPGLLRAIKQSSHHENKPALKPITSIQRAAHKAALRRSTELKENNPGKSRPRRPAKGNAFQGPTDTQAREIPAGSNGILPNGKNTVTRGGAAR